MSFLGFMGVYKHTIDKKGRVAIPAKLREGLGNAFIVTKGLDKCLFLYTCEGWEKMVKNDLQGLSMGNKSARDYKRALFSSAGLVEPDKQGRILIPQNLREYARLKEDAFVVGVDDRVEIWAGETWDVYSTEVDGSYEDNAEESLKA